jgi:RNA polymerase sigma factor (TIGR02999 family)
VEETAPGEITRLLQRWSRADPSALDELVPLVYRELRRMAASYLRHERAGHTLQPTALVHETYLRLFGQSEVECQTRAQFLAIAANLMRQILVNHAKRHKAVKRGGGAGAAMETVLFPAPQGHIDVIELDQALDKLARLDLRQCRIVEMRFFGGLTENEIAGVLGVSISTVRREWRTAKSLLHNELFHGGLA